MSYGFYRMGSNVPGKKLPASIMVSYSRAPEALLATEAIEVQGKLAYPEPPPPVTLDPGTVAVTKMTKSEARMSGYTGDMCNSCGSMRMRIAGHCMVCEGCGTTTGCS